MPEGGITKTFELLIKVQDSSPDCLGVRPLCTMAVHWITGAGGYALGANYTENF